jgi:hypothetical protein
LKRAVEKIRGSEGELLKYVKSGEFTLEGFRERFLH